MQFSIHCTDSAKTFTLRNRDNDIERSLRSRMLMLSFFKISYATVLNTITEFRTQIHSKIHAT